MYASGKWASSNGNEECSDPKVVYEKAIANVNDLVEFVKIQSSYGNGSVKLNDDHFLNLGLIHCCKRYKSTPLFEF